jgi:hypothetical protein
MTVLNHMPSLTNLCSGELYTLRHLNMVHSLILPTTLALEHNLHACWPPACRFAARQSFSADCGGGGRESNASLVPSLLQLALHLAGQCTQGELQELRSLALKHMAPLSSGGSNSSGAATGTRDAKAEEGSGGSGPAASAKQQLSLDPAPVSWPQALCLGLLLVEQEEWEGVRVGTLQRILMLTTSPARSDSSSRASSSSTSSLAAAAGGSSLSGRDRGNNSTPAQSSSSSWSTLGAGASSTPSGVAATRFIALIDWLHTHYGRLKGASMVSGQQEAQGSSTSSPVTRPRHQSPQLRGLEAGVSSLHSLHGTSQGLLSQLARIDGAGQDCKRILSVMDEAHA